MSAPAAKLLDDTAPTGTVDLDWSSRPRSVYWQGGADKDGKLMMIDQRELPARVGVVAHTQLAEVVHSIKIMLVRGAPAIGAAGAFGMALAAIASPAQTAEELLKDLAAAKQLLDDSRPTAVNLSWATARIQELAIALSTSGIAVDKFRSILLAEAQELADDDVRINKRLGDFGAALIQPGANLIHHCNTGALATVDYGTAIGVIYSAHHQKKGIHVWVDETRPRLQGARLTAWELTREGVPMHLVVDGAAGLLMYQKKVDAVVFGADRVAANGDTANKIGTYKLAVVARENEVPVYACVPTSTIDLTVASGRSIVIEERSADEVTHVGVECVAPPNCPVFNPAFDVTPAKYISAIVTEEGVCYPPFEQSLPLAKKKSDERVKEQWNKRLAAYLAK